MSERARRIRSYVAGRIKEAREGGALTQEGLADLLQLSHASISHYETGKRTVDVGDLTEIAFHTRKPLAFFLPPQGETVEGEAELVAMYRAASELDRDRLLDIARALLGR